MLRHQVLAERARLTPVSRRYHPRLLAEQARMAHNKGCPQTY